jgi:hypothetical protein
MAKRGGNYSCENCDVFRLKHRNLATKTTKEIGNLQKLVVELQKEVKHWKTRANFAESQAEDIRSGFAEVGIVSSEYCAISQLAPENCREYYGDLLRKYPLLERILEPWFSNHFQRKEKQGATNSQWMDAQGFYKAMVADMFLKSKNSKAVLRTNLILGVALYNCKMPESAWKLLTRLRLVPTITTIEHYLRSKPPYQLAQNCFLFFSYDNLTFGKHKTKKRLDNNSDMLHIATRLFTEVPYRPNVTVANKYKAYTDVDLAKFARFLVPSFAWYCNTANSACQVINNA